MYEEEKTKELEEIGEIMDMSVEKNKELLKKLDEIQKAKCLVGNDICNLLQGI
ncbi:MAG: hypothetical protein ACNYVW_06655 [Methanosarcinales archaeon]